MLGQEEEQQTPNLRLVVQPSLAMVTGPAGRGKALVISCTPVTNSDLYSVSSFAYYFL